MVEEQTGYEISRHETLFYGICPVCQGKEQGVEAESIEETA